SIYLIKIIHLMRKILPLAACLLPAFAIAQPIITGPIDFKVGESMVYEKLQPTQPGPAGAGQTWDFSAVSPIGGDTNWYYCMAPFANAPVPTANLMVVGSDGTYLYYNNQSGQGELVALADSSNSLDLTVVYQDPVKIITRPLTYNDVLVDSCKESYQIDYMGSSYNIDGEGEHQLLADGYGTLVLSDTTYIDVLRVRSEI